MAPRGRYAPSPTGELHLGNASSAMLAWLSVRSRGGTFVMRIEDLDRNRVQSGLVRRILDDLAWLGLDWDEGPDRGGPYSPYEQGSRMERYREAFSSLLDSGWLVFSPGAHRPYDHGLEVGRVWVADRFRGRSQTLGRAPARRRTIDDLDASPLDDRNYDAVDHRWNG